MDERILFTMNENNQNNSQNQAEQKETPRPRRRLKGNIAAIGIVCAMTYLVMYFLSHIDAFSGLASSVLGVFTPILLGGAIAYMLNPILKIFEFSVFKKMKNTSHVRGLSITATYLVAILMVVGFLFLLIPQLVESISDFIGKFDVYLTNTSNYVNSTYSKMIGDGEYHEILHSEMIRTAFWNFISSDEGKLITSVKDISLGFVAGIKNVVLAIFISIYILISKERLKAQTKKLTAAFLSESSNSRFYRYLNLCNKTFSGFFIGKIIDSLIIGAITLVALLIFRIPYAILVSTIVAITNIIPVFGPFIGAIPSFFIIFIQDPMKALIFLILILLIQQLDGNIIGPKILGDSTGLSSLGVIVSIVIMGNYLGIIGMILGVPLFAVAVAIVKEIIEDKLQEKNRPTDTAEYYEKNSLVDPRETHKKLFIRMITPLIKCWRWILSKLQKKSDGKNKD